MARLRLLFLDFRKKYKKFAFQFEILYNESIKRTQIVKAGASYTEECFPVFFLFG